MVTAMKLPVYYSSLEPKQRRAVREEYVRRQDGKCSHCGKPLDGPPSKDVEGKWLDMRRFPKDFLRWPIHLHHCHKTDLTISAIHARCNGVLWQYHGE